MKIGRVRIKCFRSLGDIEARVSAYTSLIGKNDCGKSSFLRALQALFDPGYRPVPEDRCSIPGQGDDWFVEATLSEGSGHNDLRTNGEIRVRRLLTESATWQYWGQTPRRETWKMMMAGTLTRAALAGDEGISKEARDLVDRSLDKGRVSADAWQRTFRLLDDAGLIDWEEGWCPLPPDRLESLVQVIPLDADARIQEEIADRNTALFGKIGGLLVRAATRQDPGLVAAIAKLNEEIERISSRGDDGKWQLDDLNRLEEVLQEEVVGFDERITIEHAILPPKLPSLEFGVALDVGDEWAKGVASMGHGLRRSIVFAMLRTLWRLSRSRTEDDPDGPLYLFLIEEPELYLHPQAERRRMRELLELSGQADIQVVLCTHSAFFVDLAEYKGIIRFERPRRELTVVHQWTGDELGAADKKTLDTTYFFDPTRAAMLFADQVILVEGQTEKVTVPALAERLKLPVDGKEVVDCAGNGSMQIYQRVLQQFRVRYVAWMDSDRMDEVRAIDKDRDHDLGRIVLTDHNWERMAELPKGGKDKPYKSWVKYVFDATEPNEAMQRRIEAAYRWQDYPVSPTASNEKKKGKGGEWNALPAKE